MVKTTGKVQKFPQKTGAAYAFKIVHNYWDKVRGYGTNKLIKTVLYVGVGQDLKDPLFRVYAWNKINKELDKLYLKKIVSRADVETAKTNFTKVLPMPSAAPIKPPRPTIVSGISARHKEFIKGK
jgi:hypothetical protein